MPHYSDPARLPKYRRHKPSGQAVVTLNGRDFYLGQYGSRESRRAYDRLTAEWLVSGRRTPEQGQGGSLTVAELSKAFMARSRRYYTRDGFTTSEVDILRQVTGRLCKLYGPTPAANFGALQFRAFRESLLAERDTEARESSRLCRATVNAYSARVKGMFRWAAAEGMLPASVWHSLLVVPGLRAGRTEARESEPVRPVADAVVDATLPHLPPVVADMVRVQRATGMRPGEVCAMTLGEIDASGDVWVYRPAHHKTAHHGKERVVCIGPRAQEILRRYFRSDLSAPLFNPAESESLRRAVRHAERVTPMNAGNRPGYRNGRTLRRRSARLGSAYTTASYARAITRACEQAGVPKWSPNQLRHTAATEARARFGLDGAGAVLGHNGLEVTTIYAERSLELAKRVAMACG